MKKIICILLALMVLIMPFTSFAEDDTPDSNATSGADNGSNSNISIAEPVAEGGGDFFSAGNPAEIYNTIDTNHAPITYIASVVNLIAIFVAIIVVLIYGIQWITANPGQKQQLKASLAPMLVGVFLIVVGPSFAMMIIRTVISAAH